jgi:hypothetical protein
MGERKVLNKYYPPDFDYTKIKRPRKTEKSTIFEVRMMMPMTVQCTTCGEYIYAGKKFNGKKETVAGEDYLGIRVFRFYMKCPQCSSQFTVKTDPENSDYKAEWGCTRNFEPWKGAKVTAEIKAAEAAAAADESADAMKLLERRTKESMREMDILEALDEIRSLNARNSKLSVDDILAAQRRRLTADAAGARDGEDADAAARAQFLAARDALMRGEGIDDDDDDADADDDPDAHDDDDANAATTTAVPKVEPKAIDAAEEDDEMERFAKLVAERKRTREGLVKAEPKAERARSPPVPVRPPPPQQTSVQVKVKAKPAKSVGVSLLGNYGSDSE